MVQTIVQRKKTNGQLTTTIPHALADLYGITEGTQIEWVQIEGRLALKVVGQKA